MNSEQEESADQLDESNANSSGNVDESFDQKGNGPREHAKPRRRRRGKKRKQKKESAATGETENPEDCEIDLLADRDHETHDESEYPGWDSDEHLSCEDNTYGDVNVILRPINVPSAPLNSTQFIIDDHNDCQFYMSFETPNPYKSSADAHYDGEIEGDIVEPIGDDAAYIDIDYQYESPQDFDNSAYYDKDFELSYKSSRFEELLRSPRTELIGRLQALESRLKELTEDLMKENPSPILEKLQAELLELQEKNSYLKESNLKLSAVLQGEVDSPDPFSCQAINLGESYSAIHDEIESEDSEKETYQECNEPEEIVMSDLNTNPSSLQDVTESYDSPTSHETAEERVMDSTGEFHHQTHGSEIKNYSLDHSQIHVSSSEQCNVGKGSPVTREEVGGSLVHSELEKNPYSDINFRKVDLNLKESRTESMCCSTTITSSDCLQAKNIHPNSCKILHSQPNNHVKDDLRTLNLSTSELLHITNQTKCSSLVPKEGGMSPSETSVN